MTTPQKALIHTQIISTLKFIKTELELKFSKEFPSENTTVFFGDLTYSFFNGTTLECVFEEGEYFIDGESYDGKGISIQFTCSYKTPKGYISSKKIPININDNNNVTLEEVTELLKFNTDAVKNTFDPFYHENEAKRRNALAWNFIAQNHISREDTF
jgi:hypothetical protein|tara:strand:- start:105 stop:575 length:471 start_codon:yes stop_codon:yes gene_type:complete